MSINKFNAEGYCDTTAFEALCNIEKAEKIYRPLIYICSPYAGNTKTNIVEAQKYSRYAVDSGYIPIAPHLLFPQFLNDRSPKERELGLLFGKVLLCKCSEVWAFGRRVAADNSQNNNSCANRFIACNEDGHITINGLNISSGMSAEIDKAKRKNIPVRYFNDACEEVKTNA